MAAVLKAGGDGELPWSSAEEMYATLNVIQEGDALWKTISFKYNGPLPKTHQNGCLKPMSSAHVILIFFYTNSFQQQASQIKSTIHHIISFRPMETVYGQT